MTNFNQRLAGFFVLTALFWLSSNTYAANASENLQQLLQPMNALSGRFTQSLIDAEGETLQESEGQFWLQKPGKLNWHTQGPFEQLLITNDENLWLYDPDLEQVTVKNIDKTLEQSPVSILSGNIADFNLHYDIEQKAGADNRENFVLLPRANEALFEKLTLSFSNGIIESMQLLDSLGQVTNITLLATQLNPEIAAEQFVFSAPPGTDVLVDD
ncbi:outer membrane lipoprotein chaperone LolA [Maricurvus nonylphenolicus]|uniref:outer membrane lipoprotein chaperone LolA n=1 Tax=Maricurvus nonylphenolicus TaxID=1008307 RepID=UPI0036F2E7A4